MLQAANTAARLLRTMGSGPRLRILCTLLQSERSSGDIARELGMREPAASQQLALLRAEGLVDARRDGQRIIYRIANPVIERLIGVLHESFCAAVPETR